MSLRNVWLYATFAAGMVGIAVIAHHPAPPVKAQQATINGVPGQTITLDSGAVMNLTTFVQGIANAMGFAQASAVPTKASQLANDAGYATLAQAATVGPVTSVNSQTGAVQLTIPTKISQLTNDAGFIAFAPFNVTFPASALLALGNYPVNVSVPSAAMGQAVECNLINFGSASYRVTGIVSAAGTVTTNLNVQAVLATNTTAPIGRCFNY